MKNIALQYIYLLFSTFIYQRMQPGKRFDMDYEKTEKVLKALADTSRLQILACIQSGIGNPKEIAHKLDRHRSTVEKHLRVLLAANLVEKTPSLTKGGHLTIQYRVREEASQLLDAVQRILEPP